MRLYTFVAHDDGDLYILEEEIVGNPPHRLFTWWPLGVSAIEYSRGGYPREWIGRKVTAKPGEPGTYEVCDPETGQIVKYLYLKNGGQTCSEYAKSVPLPQPILVGKSKDMDVKWRPGYGWYKYSAVRGWIPCTSAEIERGEREAARADRVCARKKKQDRRTGSR